MVVLLLNPEYVGSLGQDSKERKDYFERLMEQLPQEGVVSLVSPHTEILYYNKEKQLVRAGYDMQTGKIVPVESEVTSFDQLDPISGLEFMTFLSPGNQGKGKIGAAGFLTSLPTILKAPVVEIGQTSGDTYTRRVPFRHYNMKK